MHMRIYGLHICTRVSLYKYMYGYIDQTDAQDYPYANIQIYQIDTCARLSI